MFSVDIKSLRLNLRAVFSRSLRSLIPLKSQPSETLIYLLEGICHKTTSIGVFDSQDESTTMMTGKKVVKQGTSGSTYMEVASG
jgi:hypothetical protein